MAIASTYGSHSRMHLHGLPPRLQVPSGSKSPRPRVVPAVGEAILRPARTSSNRVSDCRLGGLTRKDAFDGPEPPRAPT